MARPFDRVASIINNWQYRRHLKFTAMKKEFTSLGGVSKTISYYNIMPCIACAK